MRIVVISDTHTDSLKYLPKKLLDQLKKAELIIHAGDFTEMQVLEELQSFGDVRAVCGNCDCYGLRNVLKETELIQLQGKSLGLIHGWGGPWDLEIRIMQRFNQKADMIIYGHSHKARNEVIHGIHFFNPGPARQSYGLIDITDSEIKAQIIYI